MIHSLLWSPEAQDRLDRIPFDLARERIIKRVEAYAKKIRLSQVTLEVYEAGKGNGD